MTTYKIEKGIPPPQMQGMEPRPIPYPFADMEMGDSFLIPETNESKAERLRLAVVKVAERFRNRYKADFAARGRVERQDGRCLGVRVWRVPFVPRPTKRETATGEVRTNKLGYIHMIRDEGERQPRRNGKTRS